MYLSERRVFLDNEGEEVHEEMARGCPQGSVLEPTLWNITFDELLNRNFPILAKPLAFANGVAFMIQGNSRRQMEEDERRICTEITCWASSCRMKVAVNKTKGKILKGKLAGRSPAISLANEPIQFVGQVPYLGMLLDHNLTFLPHIRRIGDRPNPCLVNYHG